jgi:choloylglycine hydrolase
MQDQVNLASSKKKDYEWSKGVTMYHKFAIALIGLSLGLFTQVEGCTGLKVTAKDGTAVHGRTLEFGVPVDFSAVVVPRGYPFQGTTPDGPGLKYHTKYAAVGMIAFDNPAIMDGMNEKGLSVGTFYFPGFAEYEKATPSNRLKGLSPVEFPNWILTQFSTLDEVKKGLSQVSVLPTVTAAWGPEPAPFHYIVYDKKGDALVIEPVGGELKVYEDTLGTFTNSPDFPWHRTNLRNWLNLSPENAEPVVFQGQKFTPMSQGSGLMGLPGDFTATSRFVRAAIYSATVIPPKDAQEGVGLVFHLLNQFDIPRGAIRQKEGDKMGIDYTQVTAVHNPNDLKYYFKTYDDPQPQKIDLTKFDLNAQKAMIYNPKGHGQAIDISDRFSAGK